MNNLFDESASVFEQQLRDIFKPAENKEQSSLFSILSLVFYHNSKITDLQNFFLLSLAEFNLSSLSLLVDLKYL